MTLIRVNPESVRAYGVQAQAHVDRMQASLGILVNDVVAVRYFGPNAVAFKTECGRLAAEFANHLHLDITAMADAVRRSTSNIAAALGGAPIHLQIDHRPITPPLPTAVEYVDVDTAALEAQIGAVSGRLGEIRDALGEHFRSLQATDWHGNAKLVAVDTVGGFTTAARGRCDQTEQVLTSFIRRQVDSVVTADR